MEDFFSGLQAPHFHHVTDDSVRAQREKGNGNNSIHLVDDRYTIKVCIQL